MPTISAACHQVIRFAIARKITSCTFIARSIAAFEYPTMLPMVCYSRRPQSGQITCYFKRTYHVLPTLTEVNLDNWVWSSDHWFAWRAVSEVSAGSDAISPGVMIRGFCLVN